MALWEDMRTTQEEEEALEIPRHLRWSSFTHFIQEREGGDIHDGGLAKPNGKRANPGYSGGSSAKRARKVA